MLPKDFIVPNLKGGNKGPIIASNNHHEGGWSVQDLSFSLSRRHGGCHSDGGGSKRKLIDKDGHGKSRGAGMYTKR